MSAIRCGASILSDGPPNKEPSSTQLFPTHHATKFQCCLLCWHRVHPKVCIVTGGYNCPLPGAPFIGMDDFHSEIRVGHVPQGRRIGGWQTVRLEPSCPRSALQFAHRHRRRGHGEQFHLPTGRTQVAASPMISGLLAWPLTSVPCQRT